MYIRLTFKLWRRYRNEHKRRVEAHELKGDMNYLSSDDEAEPIRSKDALKKELLHNVMARVEDKKLEALPVTVINVQPKDYLAPPSAVNYHATRIDAVSPQS